MNSIGRGLFKAKLIRNGKILRELLAFNAVTLVGRTYLLQTGFNGGAAITSWFAGLVDNLSFTGGDESDTAVTHAGWVEWQHYTESVRQTWPFDAAASASIANSVTEMTFSINTAGTIQGLFLGSSNTKGGTSGILFAMAEFATGPLNVLVGDVIQASYSYSIDNV